MAPFDVTDDVDVRTRRDANHYHYLLEFCHTHPGSHDAKPPGWRQEIVVRLGPDGALGKGLPDGFEAFLDARQRFGIKVGLENTRALLARLGVGDDHPPVILVGGTNGKGTVATALGQAFALSGHRPGVYTSPHVERFLERIQVSGADPDDTALEGAAAAVHAATTALDTQGVHATYFEVGTALAIEVFRRSRATPWILEVGMGGRGDAVNALEPTVSVITNVGSDHADRLGATLAERAREKAGILRPGVPAFTAAQGEALGHLAREAISKAAPLVPVLPMAPPADAATADLALVHAVVLHPTVVARFPRLAGLETSSLHVPRLPGRQERFQVQAGPAVLLDVAHNHEALAALGDALDDEPVPPERRTLLVGLVRDKPPEAAAALARGRFARVHVTRPAGERGRAAAELADALVSAGVTVEATLDDPAAALAGALAATPDDGLLVVAGSFYLAGPVRPLLRRVARRA